MSDSLIPHWFDRWIGLDPGGACIRAILPPYQSVMSEPNIVIRNTRTNRATAVGQAAADLLGRTPNYFSEIYPIADGVVDHLDAAVLLLADMLDSHQTTAESVLGRQFLVAVPSHADDVNVRSLQAILARLGARESLGVPAPIAALEGLDANTNDPLAQMVVDIGADTASVGVVARSSVIQSDVSTTAGCAIDDAIMQFLKEEFNVRISRNQAREVKHALAAVAGSTPEREEMTVHGQDTASRLPRAITVSSSEINTAIQPTVESITHFVQAFLQSISTDVAADIYTNGVHVVGGVAQLPGLASELEEVLGLSVYTDDNPETVTARGVGSIAADDNHSSAAKPLRVYASD